MYLPLRLLLIHEAPGSLKLSLHGTLCAGTPIGWSLGWSVPIIITGMLGAGPGWWGAMDKEHLTPSLMQFPSVLGFWL